MMTTKHTKFIKTKEKRGKFVSYLNLIIYNNKLNRFL